MGEEVAIRLLYFVLLPYISANRHFFPSLTPQSPVILSVSL